MKRIAINGLGRIGRLLIRAYLEQSQPPFEIVAANDLAEFDQLAYLMKFDSVHGRCRHSIELEGDRLSIGSANIRLFSEKDPAKLPWKDMGVDLVLECTGAFTKREGAMKHIQAGAEKVLISAPASDADLTIVMGVNEQKYDPAVHQIVSNASCTTNSLAPPLKVLLDNFGVEHALITTVHAYTISQSLVDKPNKKKIRGRAGAFNIIPTGTGADKATVEVLPELEGKLAATALRVPVPDGAVTDISVTFEKPATAEQINDAFRQAAKTTMKGILDISDEEIVSTDILGDSHSAIVHGLTTRVVNGGKTAKLHVWYDNEYGYASRLLDAAAYMVR